MEVGRHQLRPVPHLVWGSRESLAQPSFDCPPASVSVTWAGLGISVRNYSLWWFSIASEVTYRGATYFMWIVQGCQILRRAAG